MDDKTYYALRTFSRQCSAGSRYFFILSNGLTARCASQKYQLLEYIGNITDQNFLIRILEDKDQMYWCKRPDCIPECDGRLSHQIMDTGEEHVGTCVDLAGGKDANYCNLQIHLTHACNYECPYCIAESWMTYYRKDDLSLGQWMEAGQFFVTNFRQGTCILLGGEPLISNAFVPLVSLFLDFRWRVEVVTNFTRVEIIEKICEKYRGALGGFHVCVSLHPVNKGFDFDAILKKVQDLKEQYGMAFSFALVETELNNAVAKKYEIDAKIAVAGFHLCRQTFGTGVEEGK